MSVANSVDPDQTSVRGLHFFLCPFMGCIHRLISHYVNGRQKQNKTENMPFTM